jgi:UDP-N-acetylglucosamine:LPS N-acetylglucosamine transferase
MKKKGKICLAFSAGGHQTEMEQVIEAFNEFDIFFVTTKKASSKYLKNAYYVNDTGPTRKNLFINMVFIIFQSLRILITEHPRAIVSTGADITIPLCYWGRMLGAKVIFIESICRVKDLSPTGKLVYPIANTFLVQWPSLLKDGSKAVYWGQVI